MGGILDVFTAGFLGPPDAPDIEVPEAPPPPPAPPPAAVAPPAAAAPDTEGQAADRARAEELARQRRQRASRAATGIASSPLGSPGASSTLQRPVLGR